MEGGREGRSKRREGGKIGSERVKKGGEVMSTVVLTWACCRNQPPGSTPE